MKKSTVIKNKSPSPILNIGEDSGFSTMSGYNDSGLFIFASKIIYFIFDSKQKMVEIYRLHLSIFNFMTHK